MTDWAVYSVLILMNSPKSTILCLIKNGKYPNRIELVVQLQLVGIKA